MKYYLKSIDETLTEVSSGSSGLTAAEASARLEKNGKNKLAEAKKDSLFKRFMIQLADPMIIILIVAAVISGVTSFYSGESFADVIIILAVVIINAVLGILQESKAEKAIEALQEMSAATSKVLRDGKITSIRSEELVVGDLMFFYDSGFTRISHVAVYIGNNQIIHASSSAGCVTISNIGNWHRTYFAWGRRVF